MGSTAPKIGQAGTVRDAATVRRVYAERGDTANAVEYYNRFVDLWRDADPELQPIVRERLARLVGEG